VDVNTPSCVALYVASKHDWPLRQESLRDTCMQMRIPARPARIQFRACCCLTQERVSYTYMYLTGPINMSLQRLKGNVGVVAAAISSLQPAHQAVLQLSNQLTTHKHLHIIQHKNLKSASPWSTRPLASASRHSSLRQSSPTSQCNVQLTSLSAKWDQGRAKSTPPSPPPKMTLPLPNLNSKPPEQC